MTKIAGIVKRKLTPFVMSFADVLRVFVETGDFQLDIHNQGDNWYSLNTPCGDSFTWSEDPECGEPLHRWVLFYEGADMDELYVNHFPTLVGVESYILKSDLRPIQLLDLATSKVLTPTVVRTVTWEVEA